MPFILALETILWCGVLNVCNALSHVNTFVVLGTVVGNCTEKKYGQFLRCISVHVL